MSYSVKPANIFGRIGEEAGKSLAESIPKEAERYRLSAGLKALGEKQGLTPFQQYAELISQPGITPQAVQTGGELLREQGIREGFKKASSQGQRSPGGIEQVSGGAPSGNYEQFLRQQQQPTQNPNAPLATQPKTPQPPNVSPSESGQPQIVPKGSLSPDLIPKTPWTPQELSNEIDRLADLHPNLPFSEIRKMALENEQRYLSMPEAARKVQDYRNEVQTGMRKKFDENLELKLQKKGDATFADVSGAMRNNLYRGMERDRAEHPEKSDDDIVNHWTERAFNLAKANTQLKGKADRSIFASPILFNKEGYRKDLEQLGKLYEEAGNSEEFYKQLQELYGLSPMGAASITYKPSKHISSFLNSISPAKFEGVPDLIKNEKKARSRAIEVEKLMTPKDSPLTILREIMSKDPYFDKQTFINQLLEDQDQIGLTADQKRQLGDAGQLMSSWGDFLILPFFRSVK